MEVGKEPRSLPVRFFTTQTPRCFVIKVVGAPGTVPRVLLVDVMRSYYLRGKPGAVEALLQSKSVARDRECVCVCVCVCVCACIYICLLNKS